MKFALLTLSLFCLTSQALAESQSLTFKNTIELKKTTVAKDLPVDLIKLYRAVNIEEKRMIAGEFEISARNTGKKTYLDGLRSKLQGCKGFSRF